ncbi:MAG: hypothetical protein D3922_02870 [Candidatus Electrothrix sp. AR1]|nr:hypothetical protein [Candidatus Electrothrix sp. AR1]
MYLARRFRDNRVYYLLRESFLDNGIYRNRDLIELGEDPGRFFVYPGDFSFYIDDLIFTRLQETGIAADYDTVEPLFMPFLDPEIRARLDSFSGRGQGGRSWRPPDKEERQHILATTHVFDRRRIHFLRFGQVDQRDVDRSPSLFRILLHKSRDELEQLMLEREQYLSPDEYKAYIFTIFDLQRHFNGAFARAMPYALDDDQLDGYFLKEHCRLDQERFFWQGLERDDDLVSNMIRYVIMFFDYSFPQTGPGPDPARSSFGGQQQARPHTPPQPHMAQKEAASIFGVDPAGLDAMSKTELTRLYRQKAQELHPDKGGEHEEFIALTSAYNELLRNKPE